MELKITTCCCLCNDFLISEGWRGLTKQLAMPFHEMNSLKIYLADSFPVPVCRNIRIQRCKIYQDECFRGRVSSRKEYFYGLKVHALMTESGIPVEIGGG